jgi:quinol monooxygenase YgiN
MCEHDAMEERAATGRADGRIAVIIEWRAPGLTPEAARRLADETVVAFRRVPGLIDIRLFGDFDSGDHVYFQVWRDRAALDAYLASEAMLRMRDAAGPYVEGRPSRRIYADYTEAAPEAIG